MTKKGNQMKILRCTENKMNKSIHVTYGSKKSQGSSLSIYSLFNPDKNQLSYLVGWWLVVRATYDRSQWNGYPRTDAWQTWNNWSINDLSHWTEKTFLPSVLTRPVRIYLPSLKLTDFARWSLLRNHASRNGMPETCVDLKSALVHPKSD